jgi:hypothetical protein
MTLPEAGQVIDSMKGTPALLAVIVLQLATLLMVYFISVANGERQQAREIALIQACRTEETP